MKRRVAGLVVGIVVLVLGILLGLGEMCSISSIPIGGGASAARASCQYPAIVPSGMIVAGLVLLVGSFAAVANSPSERVISRREMRVKLLLAVVPVILVSVGLAVTPHFALDDGDLPTAWGIVLYGGAALICLVALSRILSFSLRPSSPLRETIVLSVVLFMVITILATSAFSPPDLGTPLSVKHTVSEMHCYNFSSPGSTGYECDEVGFAVVYSPFQIVLDVVFWLSLASLPFLGALAALPRLSRLSVWTAVGSLYSAALLAPTVSAETRLPISLAARWSPCSASVCHGFSGPALLADFGFWFIVFLAGTSILAFVLTRYIEPTGSESMSFRQGPVWRTRRFGLALGLAVGIFVASVAVVTLGPSVEPTSSGVAYSIGPAAAEIRNQSVGLDLGLHLHRGSNSDLILTVSEANLLPRDNNITGASRWLIPSTLLGQDCPPSPFGFGIFAGFLGADNYTVAKNYSLERVLFLYNTDEKTLPNCHWNSVPMPHNQVRYGENDTISVALRGSWTGGLQTNVPATFHDFVPGRYTVLALDEWGQLTIAHFEVKTA